jgi:glutamyl-tRNA synthetase
MAADEFAAAARPFLDAGPWDPAAFDEAAFLTLAPEVQTRVTKLSDVPGLVDFLFLPAAPDDPRSWERTMTGPAAAILAEAQEAFAVVPWERDALYEAAAAIAERHDMKLGKAQAPVRVAVMGRDRGLPLFESLVVLGRSRTLSRIDAALARLA